jgi:hypothetical protein
LQAHLNDWLPLARLGTLPFWLVLLLAGYLGGRLWGGELAGRLAVAMLAVEPILLGHACLAATDLAFTACLVLLVVACGTGRDGPFFWRIVIPAILVGLTLLAKASGVVFIPVCLLAVECEYRCKRGFPWDCLPWSTAYRDYSQIAVGGLAVVFLLCPRALRIFWLQIMHNTQGHGLVYLLGDTSASGFWYYFAAALAIKVSLALLLWLVIFLRRPGYLVSGPMLAAIGLLLLSPSYRVQTGVRFVLPIVALGIIGVAIALARCLADCRSLGLRRLTWVAVALTLGWTFTQAVRVWPEGLCYTNELFGGTEHGYVALSDSNCDWGQGLPELARWQRGHGPAPLDVWYFGTDSRVKSPPFHLVDAGQAASIEELERQHAGRYLAVSTTLLFQYGYATPGARLLRDRNPAAQTPTFLIYDFTGHVLPEQNHSSQGRRNFLFLTAPQSRHTL